tara:strand:+ start:646 stop:2373 length:1728 start_codon:yes stop_codon:yes gene_type:complete
MASNEVSEKNLLLEKSYSFLNDYSQVQIQSEEEFEKVINEFSDPNWLSYKNVRWQWRKGGSINNPLEEGEVDFLLVHKELGVVLIEVKGGTGWSYDATKDSWTVKTANGPKDAPGPYNQISRNAAGLRSRIQSESKSMGIKNFRPPVNKFVAWTNVSSSESKFGFLADDSNTIFAEELNKPLELEEKIKKQFTNQDYSDNDLINLFRKILNNNVKGFSLVSYNGKLKSKVEKLSEDIFKTYYDITNPDYKKVKIQGIPGTGKTFLATKLAEHESVAGNKVLFLCYNLLLGKKLQENLSDYENIEVLTFESFINKLGISYDDLIDNGDGKYKLKDLDKDKEIAYLKNALENAIVEADEIFQFNTLIIDESQDISEEFWDFFTELVNAKDAKWVVCYDKNQRITHVNWKPPEYLDNPQLILNTVIRSTKEIAKTYSKLYEDQIEHYGETGLTPELMLLKNGSWDEANYELENILKSLKKESKNLLWNTTILVPHSKDIENLKLKSDYRKRCVVESISRFKGLESDVVIVVFPSLEGIQQHYINSTLALVYVGLSRAKSKLYLIGNREVQELCNWKVI